MNIDLSLEHVLEALHPHVEASLFSAVGATLRDAFSASFPEPSTAVLLLSGVAMLVLIIARR